MVSRLKDDYFLIIRMILMPLFFVYAFGSAAKEAEVSVWMLLLALLYISAIALKELFEGKIKLIFLFTALVSWGLLMALGGGSYILPGVFLGFEFFLFFMSDTICISFFT